MLIDSRPLFLGDKCYPRSFLPSSVEDAFAPCFCFHVVASPPTVKKSPLRSRLPRQLPLPVRGLPHARFLSARLWTTLPHEPRDVMLASLSVDRSRLFFRFLNLDYHASPTPFHFCAQLLRLSCLDAFRGGGSGDGVPLLKRLAPPTVGSINGFFP